MFNYYQANLYLVKGPQLSFLGDYRKNENDNLLSKNLLFLQINELKTVEVVATNVDKDPSPNLI